MNWLEQQTNYKKDRQAIQDAYNAQNIWGEYLGVDFPKYQEDINCHQQFWTTTTKTRMGATTTIVKLPSKYPGNFYNSFIINHP
jgi:hypothetical protein